MLDRKTLPNPFDNDVVADPSKTSPVDVPRIHRVAFELCRSGYERVAYQSGSWSVLLFGVAGCGKTHLLSRFRRWLAGELEEKPTIPAALFVGVRMETGSGMIWRHLRRRFADELMQRTAEGYTKLDRILDLFARRWGGDLGEAFESAPEGDYSHEMTRVFEHFAAGRHRRLCRAWLRGDGISENDVRALDLPPSRAEEMDEEWAEADARLVIQAITRLCAPRPVVFCFDQIEALSLSHQIESYGRFSQMGASLVDGATNAFLISTISADFLNDLQRGSRFADYHRIRRDQADLQPLDFTLGRELVKARLTLMPEEVGQETPITDEDLRAFFRSQHDRATPRSLIHQARRLFAQWQDKAMAAPLSVDAFLSGEFERLWGEAEVRGDPHAADSVLTHGLPIALDLLGRKPQERPARHIDLAAPFGTSTVRMAFANQAQPASLARWLAKLQDQVTPSSPLCIIRDARLTIPPTAKATQQRLAAIAQAGGRVVRVGAEALAALDAMRKLLATATSGDLSLDGKTVEGQTVREWLKGNLPKEVTNLAAELLGEADHPAEPEPNALLELLKDRKVIALDDAVRLTEMPRDILESYARRHPDRVGFFAGAIPVLFLAIGPPA